MGRLPITGKSTGSYLCFPAIFVLVGLTAEISHIHAQEIQRAVSDPGSMSEATDTYDSTHNAREVLGRYLFWDPILSGNRDTACATCHHPEYAYTDGRDLSRGTLAQGLGPDREDQSNGEIPLVRRNAPTVLNTALNGMGSFSGNGLGAVGGVGSLQRSNTGQRAPMFWDSRIRSLEKQALEPIKAFEEMRGFAYPAEQALDTVVSRLGEIPAYRSLFANAFGEGAVITAEYIGTAIAAFERTLIAMNSPVDKFLAGDSSALTPQQIRGKDAFEKARCDSCHGGPMFSDYTLHTQGVPENGQVSEADAGAGEFSFRTPTLRNIALTAPYMHNGTLPTLDDVLLFYNRGQSENPNVAGAGEGLGANGLARLDASFIDVPQMSDREMADITAFLEALTDEGFDRSIPAEVPSGLTPGGSIRMDGAEAFVQNRK